MVLYGNDYICEKDELIIVDTCYNIGNLKNCEVGGVILVDDLGYMSKKYNHSWSYKEPELSLNMIRSVYVICPESSNSHERICRNCNRWEYRSETQTFKQVAKEESEFEKLKRKIKN